MGHRGTYRSVDEVFLAYEKLVYLFLRDHVKDPDLVNELNQVFWLRVCEKQDCVLHQSKENMTAYLRAMVRNLVNDHFNGKSREQSILEDMRCLQETNGVEEGVESEIFKKASEECIDRAIAMLKPGECDFLLLYYEKGVTCKDLSEMLGISPELVRTRAMRLKKKLQTELTRLMEE